MSTDAAIREYLAPGADTFWQWSEEGEVLVWKDGKTIAFRDELRSVLEWLAPHGLPSLHSIALVLAATHDSWGEDNAEAGILAGMFTQANAEHLALLNEVIVGLDKIRHLDRDLRTPLAAKQLLVEMVLETCRRDCPSATARSVVDVMHRGMGEILTAPALDIEFRGYDVLLLARDLRAIAQGLTRVDAKTLRLKLTTGIEELPKAAELELPPSAAAQALLDSLADDEELSALAKIAKRLLALTALPRRLSIDERLEHGGFSDIANRGSPERLLLSELANDDLTLAVRIAMNEALYLRRETPPSPPNVHRAILMDVGLRTWGVPRIFATAAALAFTASTAATGSVNTFRARKLEAESANLVTREGLVNHLAVLETELHPGDAVTAFLNKLPQDGDPAEVVFLLTDDALADPGMQKRLRELDLPQLFLATVNRDGEFKLFERGLHGTKLLRQANIDINSLFQSQPRLIDDKLANRLPAIFSADSFPLLLPHNIEHDHLAYVDDFGVFAVTRDRRLMLWQKAGQGARQINDDIPDGNILWISPLPVDGHVTLLVGKMRLNGVTNTIRLLHVDQHARVVESIPIRTRHFGAGMFVHAGAVFQVCPDAVQVFSARTGELLQTVSVPRGLTWVPSRFFSDGSKSKWYGISFDGQTAHLDQIRSTTNPTQTPLLITLFERPGKDGPIGITTTGALFYTATGNIARVRHGLTGQISVPWVSRDGRHVQLRGEWLTRSNANTVLVDTENLACTAVQSNAADHRILPLVTHVSLRHKFHAIGVDSSGHLALRSYKGNTFRLEVRHGLPVLAADPSGSWLESVAEFTPLTLRDRGYKLSNATWSDGSRAVLDSRGLLHLMSANEGLPHVTMVLAEGEWSGWSSDGRLWGKQFFVGTGPRHSKSAATQQDIYRSIVVPFLEHLNA